MRMALVSQTVAGPRCAVRAIMSSIAAPLHLPMCAACACRFMVGLQTLKFKDSALEILFRGHWDSNSRTLLTLLSVVTLGIWAVATWNVHTHCSWSRFLCRFLEALCSLVILTHIYIQCQLRMFPGAACHKHNPHFLNQQCSHLVILSCPSVALMPAWSHPWQFTFTCSPALLVF